MSNPWHGYEADIVREQKRRDKQRCREQQHNSRHVETEEEKENNEFWQQLQESILYRDRKERAKREANEEYEKYLLQKIREDMECEEDLSSYSWNIITCEKKRVDVMFVEPYNFSDFDFLTLLSKSDQKFIKRWMEAN